MAAMLPLILSGCVTTSSFNPHNSPMAFGLETLVELTTSTPDGVAIYQVSSLTNASMFLKYGFPWSSDRFNLVQILFVEEGGKTWYPSTLQPEGAPHSEPSEIYVGWGREHHNVASVPRGAPEKGMEGAEIHFTDATRGWLAVWWKNLSGPLTIETYWTPQTDVVKIHEGAAVEAHTMHQLRNGLRLGTLAAQATWDASFEVGEPGQQVLTALKVYRPLFSEGTLTVTSEGRTETIDLDAVMNKDGSRYHFITTGRTTFTVCVVGVTSPEFTTLSVSLPREMLPPFWSETWQMW